MLHALIMAGGGGTRFWPRSRAARPKQFLSLAGDRSLIQSTFDRVGALAPPSRSWVITGAAHAAEAARQLPDVPPGQVVGEPVGRDTAAAVGLGAALIARADPRATILVMPADHVIEPAEEFRRACHAAELFVEENPGALVTFGIPPNYPATGYGYIRRGPEAGRRQGVAGYQVLGFREKPNADLAENYVSTGEYYWNSGIFAWKAATILGQLQKHKPDLHAALVRIADAWGTAEQDDVFRREYEGLEKISIDYAVMEKAEQVLVLQAPYRWDDVGSWLALERMNPQDADGNTVRGSHCGVDTYNCVVVGDSGKLIATVGVHDLIVIQDGDAVLVADRRREGDVKLIVEKLKKSGLEKYL
jgi:mannose-1-phosphate guanylyltransferase